MKKLLLSLFLLAALGVLPRAAYADCQTVYGGGQTCSNTFSIQKATTNGSIFSMSQTVDFQITVTNTGSQTIPTITVVDTFPQFLNFVSGPGTFNSSNNTLTYVVNNLGSGQKQSVDVSGNISGSGVPAGICLVNKVLGTDNNGNTNTASSQFCIQNGVTPTPTQVLLPVVKVTKTPPTGPEMLPIIALIPGALSGLYLRKKSKKSLIEGGEK
jgi:uncharacterized repeat protein (TIGR01451 family)